MRFDDIIALVLIVGAGGVGYLLYTKQLDWFDSDSPKTKKEDEGEEEKIIKDIKEPESKNIIPKNKDFKIPEFLEDFFDKPSSSGNNNIISGAQDFVSDWVDRGRKAIDNLVKPFTKPTTTTIIPKNKDFKKPTLDRYFFDKSGETSLDDLITDAFRGNPFKPYPGATDPKGQKYRPYD